MSHGAELYRADEQESKEFLPPTGGWARILHYYRECRMDGGRLRRSESKMPSTTLLPVSRRSFVPALAWALVLSIVSPPALHAQPAAAGRVKVISGSAFIIRQQKSMEATVGAIVFESDVLRTGDEGRLGVTLRDDTRVSLGPKTELRLSRIAYAPAEGQLALVLSIARGVVAYVSGQIARLSADAVRVETPDAVIGVRGTRIAIRVAGR
jgi:hypothetical protein